MNKFQYSSANENSAFNPPPKGALINGWAKEGVINHIQQNFKGKAILMDGNGRPMSCLYRTPDGRKCIAGTFMSDGALEELDKNNLLSMTIQSQDIWDMVGKEMPLPQADMVEWQQVHDGLSDDQTLQQQKDRLIDHFVNIAVEELTNDQI